LRFTLEPVAALWARVFTPPWRALRHVGPPRFKYWRARRTRLSSRAALWALGWGWSLVGIILGAFLAPALLNQWGAAQSDLARDVASCGVAALMGYVVQTLSFGLLLLFVAIWGLRPEPLLEGGGVSSWVSIADELEYMTTDRPQVIASSVILVGESAALWWYVTTQVTLQGAVATYVLGGLIIKVVSGLLVTRVFWWLRGETGEGTRWEGWHTRPNS
jgi:hypothetical protein